MPVMTSSHKNRRIIRSTKELTKPLPLKDYYQKRNKLLIIRGVGGLGDILMHRMMFEDFKRLAPDVEIHFACPKQYHQAVVDHPYVEKVLTMEEYQREDYLISYMTTTACGRYELKKAPHYGKHRSDIWANHCGVELTNHNMHFHLTEEEKQEGRRLIEGNRDRPGPSVMLAPISAMELKNFLDFQLLGIVRELRERGMYVFGSHHQSIYTLIKNDVPVISGVNLRQWLAMIDQVDYVISVDTAAFHAAGGMKKPVVGVFTFANAETYGRYYPTAELVQGPCPFNYFGCYNWGLCPEKKRPKPCLTELKVEDVMSKVDDLLKKWPVQHSI